MSELKFPNYPYTNTKWFSALPSLFAIASRGGAVWYDPVTTRLARRPYHEAITLMARECTARLWCDVMDYHPGGVPLAAFVDINVPVGADPTTAYSLHAGGIAGRAHLFYLRAFPGDRLPPTVRVRRSVQVPIENPEPGGPTYRNDPAPARDPSIYGNAMTSIIATANALIADLSGESWFATERTKWVSVLQDRAPQYGWS